MRGERRSLRRILCKQTAQQVISRGYASNRPQGGPFPRKATPHGSFHNAWRPEPQSLEGVNADGTRAERVRSGLNITLQDGAAVTYSATIAEAMMKASRA